MMIKGILPWRRLLEALQAVLIVGLPFLKINGESALRFDISTLKLHFFGISLWMEQFFIVVVAVIFLTLLGVLITILFGRIWCGWLCPQTVIVDFTRFVDKANAKGQAYKIGAYIGAFAVSVFVAANLIWYFVSPYEFFERLLALDLGKIIWGFWIALTSIVFLNFAFLRHRFCATVCPYAKMQSVLYDNKTLVIAFNPSRKKECIDCMACVRICPVDIDIRKGLSGACINCAECIDKCTEITSKIRKKSLINYSFGLPGTDGRIIRQNVVMLSLAMTAFFFFTLYLLFSRVPVDLMAIPNQNYPPRNTADGSTINSYFLLLRNLSIADMELCITASKEGGKVFVMPETVFLRAGENRNVPIFIRIGKVPPGGSKIEISVESRKHDEMIKITKRVLVRPPES